MSLNLYELLKIRWGADESEVRSRIEQAAQDGSVDSGLLNAARQALLNPANRKRYDEQLTKQYAEADKKTAKEIELQEKLSQARIRQQHAQQLEQARYQRIAERNEAVHAYYEYKVITLMGYVAKNHSDAPQKAAEGLQQTINQNAIDGWEFYGTESVTVIVQPPVGCLSGLFGQQSLITTQTWHVAVFRRPIGA